MKIKVSRIINTLRKKFNNFYKKNYDETKNLENHRNKKSNHKITF